MQFYLFQEATADVQQTQKRRKTTAQHLADKNELLRNALEHLKNKGKEETKDDASVYAESWATSYRKLSGAQKIFAKKAIEEILVLGQLDQLSLNSIQAPSSPCYSSRTSTPSLQYSLSSSPVDYTIPSNTNNTRNQSRRGISFSSSSSRENLNISNTMSSNSSIPQSSHHIQSKIADSVILRKVRENENDQVYENVQYLLDDSQYL